MEEPDNCPGKLYDLMRRCWAHKPSMRPSFLELVTDLLPEVNESFASVSYYHSEEGQELRSGGVGNETTPFCITRDIEDFSLGSDDEDNYKQASSSGKMSNGSTTPNGFIVARSNGLPTKTTKC